MNIKTLPEYAARAKGYLKIEERRKLFELAQGVPDSEWHLILNIGIEYGASMICLRAGNKQATLTGIDIDCSKLIKIKEIDWYGNINIREMTSMDAFSAIQQDVESLSLLFIDGDHGYRGVTLDTLYCDLLEEDGIVMFHDCYDWEEPDKPHRKVPGVMAAVDDWFIGIMKGDNDFIELPKVGTSRLFKRIK